MSIAILLGVIGAWTIVVWRDYRRSGYRLGVYFALRAMWLFCKLFHGVRPRGPDPLPRHGPAILISNHTSPADPFFLQCASRRLILFLMAREYYDIKFLRPIFDLGETILVNRTGRDTAAMKATLRALRQGRVIGIFPEGGIHLDPHTLGDAKPGAALLALLTRAPVIPALIDRRRHTNQILHGILQPAPTRVFFGKPIDLRPYFGKEHDDDTLDEVTSLMMTSIDRLRPNRGNTNP